MDKSLLKFCSDGDPNLAVWRIPASITELQQDCQAFALPIMSRTGGALFAVHEGVLSNDALLDGMTQEELLGPSREFEASLCVEDDVGHITDLALKGRFLVVDIEDSVLLSMREYDPVTDSTENIRPFSLQHVNSLPKISEVYSDILAWIEQVSHERLNFYSAREELEAPPPTPVPVPKRAAAKRTPKATAAGLAEKVDALQAQVQLWSCSSKLLLLQRVNKRLGMQILLPRHRVGHWLQRFPLCHLLWHVEPSRRRLVSL